MKCPHCHKNYHVPEFEVNLNNNNIRIDNKIFKLSYMETEIAYAILKKYPNTAHYDYIIQVLYGHQIDIPESNIVISLISRIRTKLKDSRLTIINENLRGYRFEVERPAPFMSLKGMLKCQNLN